MRVTSEDVINLFRVHLKNNTGFCYNEYHFVTVFFACFLLAPLTELGEYGPHTQNSWVMCLVSHSSAVAARPLPAAQEKRSLLQATQLDSP